MINIFIVVQETRYQFIKIIVRLWLKLGKERDLEEKLLISQYSHF